MNTEAAAGDCVRFEAPAQQLSASDCVMMRVPESWVSAACIGQLVPLLQHAIRASGAACHPAQATRFPAVRIPIVAAAASRLTNTSTLVA